MAKARLTAGRARMVSNAALKVRELREVLARPFGKAHPADASDVGDRIAVREKFAPSQALVHDAVEPVDLVGVARDGVEDFRRRVTAEMHHLPGHWPEPADLPVQPLLDGDARALFTRIKFSALAAEILQDGAGFERRDMRLFGERIMFRNSGANCSPFEMSTGRTT